MNRLALAAALTLTACGTPMTEQPLAAPSELLVYQLGIGLHLTWKDNSPDEDEFQIERKSNGGYTMIGAVEFDLAQYHDEPVTFDAAYTYRVRAMKGNVPSAYSNAATATAMALVGAGGGGGSNDAGSGGGAGGGGGTSNLPPSCTIDAPDGGTVVPFDQVVTFSASASDPEDGSLSGTSVVWTSDRAAAPLGSGVTLSRTLPSPGLHTVTCTATDSQGLTGSSSTTLTAISPVARISHPGDGETRAAGSMIPFIGDGQAFEEGPVPDAGLVWTSSIDGVIGTGRTFSRSLSAGTNVITLTVTDSDGGTGAQSISLTITP